MEMLDKNTIEAISILPLYCPSSTVAEILEALPIAKRKLDLIIQREGDANGLRVEPKYLAMLISEIIKQRVIQRETLKKEKKHEAEATVPLINAIAL